MTSYEFKSLDLNEQAVALLEGIYLEIRFEGEHTVQLYSLNDFYVEVYYSPKGNRIIKLVSFRSTKLLDPFLSYIKIGGLL
jgi:hypothetical protein